MGTGSVLEEHQGLLTLMANDFARRYNLDFDDMFQEGYLALQTASERFDPDAGYKFSTYARWWVARNLHEHGKEFMFQVRIPRGALAQVAEYPIDDSEEGQCPFVETSPDPAECCAWSELIGMVPDLLNRLPKIQRLIIFERFWNKTELVDLGTALGKSRGWVIWQQKLALEQMRKWVCEASVEDVDNEQIA